MRRLLALSIAGMLLAPQLNAQSLDRTHRPNPAPPVTMSFPKVERRTLSNGMVVALFENHELPLVSVNAVIDVTGLLDPPDKDGLVAILQQMLTEGTTTRSADELAAAFADLGNTVSPFGFTTVTPNVDRSLELMADMLMHPAFPQASLDRIRNNEIASLRRVQDQPAYMAQRVFANALYGTGHPFERVRTEQSLNNITRDALLQFHNSYYRPENIEIVMAGDIKPADALAKLERAFGAWPKGGTKVRYDAIPPVAAASSTKIYLFDRPNSPQSIIMVGEIGPRRDSPDYYAIQLMNDDLGGMFNSRINMNLREKHAYTYGANSGFSYRKAPMPGTFTASSQVVTNKTDSALIELFHEIRDIREGRPITAEELGMARANETMSLPLRFEALTSMSAAVASMLRDDLPLDYYNHFASNIDHVTAADVTAAARKYLDPDHLAIIVVGDRKQIEAGLRKANIAPVVVVDEHARPIPVP